MVTLRETASHIKEVKEEEWNVLFIIERNIDKYERYPVEKLIEKTGYNYDFIINIIDHLREFGWIEYFKQPYESVRLLTSGVDAIALKILADKDIVIGIGRQIGVGKEADIYEAMGPKNELLSIKFFRLGRISFRDITRKRDYYNVYSPKRPGWILRNYSAAKKEFTTLKFLYENGVKVPKPIIHVKHTIVMEELKGALLINIKSLSNPAETFWKIITEVKKAYDLNIINGDLSPFNVFITLDEEPIIIDWPQATKRKNENINLLKRDLDNIINFFIKRFELEVNKKDIYRMFGIA